MTFDREKKTYEFSSLILKKWINVQFFTVEKKTMEMLFPLAEISSLVSFCHPIAFLPSPHYSYFKT